MNRYFDHEMGFSDLFKRSFRLHYLTLKHTIPCILFITIAKYISASLIGLFQNIFVQAVIYIAAIAVIAYFFAVALLETHRSFIDKPQSIRDAIKTVWKRITPIATTFVAYIIGGIIVFIFMQSLLFAAGKIFQPSSNLQLFLWIIKSIFLMVYIAVLYFSFPLTIIDETPVFKAFYNSAVLTEKQKWGVFVLFFIFSAIVLLLTPGTINEYFLSVYHLDILFDFVVLCVAIPLYINLLLLLMHNAKLQVVFDD